jgi:hypothetical protein
MADEDQIKLELEPTEEKVDDIVIVDAPEDIKIEEKPQLSPEVGINELKLQLEEATRAREAAERRAKEAYEQAAAAKNDAADSNMRMLDNAIETLKRNQEILKQNLRDAVASGDTDAQADIMMSLNKSENDLREVTRGKQHYELATKKAAADPVEALASQLTPKSAEWIRAHPEAVHDPVLNRKLRRAHEDAVDDGIAPDTPEYFSYVENRLKIRQAPVQQQESALSEASGSHSGRRAAAPPAAPVSRSGTGTGSRPNVVTLTRAEQEAARDMGMTPKEYAENKMALVRAGKLAG